MLHEVKETISDENKTKSKRFRKRYKGLETTLDFIKYQTLSFSSLPH